MCFKLQGVHKSGSSAIVATGYWKISQNHRIWRMGTPLHHTLLVFSSCLTFWFWTGFWAYITTATEMRPRARTVLRVRGIPSIGTLSIAVITSSRAEANAFKMEFSFFRNKLVTIPRTELFIINNNTRGLLIDSNDDNVNAVKMSPWN